MMAGNGIFSLGLFGPLILLFLGFVTMGLLFSGVAIVVRLRADSEKAARGKQSKIDSAIAILAGSAVLFICGVSILHIEAEFNIGILLVAVGLFLLWPLSAILAILGRGAGRKVLLVGHGLIAAWVSLLLLIVLVHYC
jgi:hypothetical protein